MFFEICQPYDDIKNTPCYEICSYGVPESEYTRSLSELISKNDYETLQGRYKYYMQDVNCQYILYAVVAEIQIFWYYKVARRRRTRYRI